MKLVSTKNGAWQDPSVWGGVVPTLSDCVEVRHVVTISGDAQCGRCEVFPASELAFDPNATSTLESAGNVVVRGAETNLSVSIARLRMQPPSRAIVHTLRFVGINESQIVGGGNEVLETDVGLWVMGHGSEIILEGTSVGEGWNRSGTHAAWLATDELVRAPIANSEFDPVPHVMGAPVPYQLYRGERYRAEVVNATRNVRIEGTPTGYAHVLIYHASRASRVRDVSLRHCGPDDGPDSTPRGRYALHMHHCHAPGFAFERVIVRDCKSRAFVVHGSKGPTQLRECVAINAKIGFWWDESPHWQYPGNASFGVTYDRCGALGYSAGQGAFVLGQGEGNSCIDCFAAGGTSVVGAGFFWNDGSGFQPNVWAFYGCRAHNTKGYGIRTWQNDHNINKHHVSRYAAFRCASGATLDGAYFNAYSYDHGISFRSAFGGRGLAAFEAHAASRDIDDGEAKKRYSDNIWDGDGKVPAIHFTRSAGGGLSDTPIEVVRNVMLGGFPTAVRIQENSPEPQNPVRNKRLVDFLENYVGEERRDLEPSDFTVVWMRGDSVYRVQRSDGTCFQVHPDGTSTVLPNNTVSDSMGAL